MSNGCAALANSKIERKDTEGCKSCERYITWCWAVLNRDELIEQISKMDQLPCERSLSSGPLCRHYLKYYRYTLGFQEWVSLLLMTVMISWAGQGQDKTGLNIDLHKVQGCQWLWRCESLLPSQLCSRRPDVTPQRLCCTAIASASKRGQVSLIFLRYFKMQSKLFKMSLIWKYRVKQAKGTCKATHFQAWNFSSHVTNLCRLILCADSRLKEAFWFFNKVREQNVLNVPNSLAERLTLMTTIATR